MLVTHSCKTSLVPVAAHFHTGGISGFVILNQADSNKISVDNLNDILPHDVDPRSIQWEIHELPVDVTIDPKDRCKSEFIGPKLYTSGPRGTIDNVNASSLFLHSIVLLINNKVVTCATIGPEYAINPLANVILRSGVFGKIQVMEHSWSGE